MDAETPQPDTPQMVPAPGRTAQSRGEKLFLFACGFLGWFSFDALFWLANGRTVELTSRVMDESVTLGGVCIITPIIFLTLILLAIFKGTRWIAFGILVALAVNFLISQILGLFFSATCFIPFFIR